MEEEIVIDLPRTEYYTIRKKLMNNVGEPAKLSECRMSLGDFLATLIFNYCPDGLSAKFGLDYPLEGPGEDLWCSPSDLLEGKVCLKPPYSRKYIQALTHEGIIEMGYEIEKKFYNEMEEEKKRALVAQKAKFNEAFDTQLRQNLKDYEVQSRMECERKMRNLADQFEIHLIHELQEFENKLYKQFEQEKVRLIANHKREMNRSTAQAIQITVKDLTKKFVKELNDQKYRLTKQFEYEIQKAEIRKQFDLRRRDAYCAEALKQLEHNLECRNIANMMYVICMERRKCAQEREELLKSHQFDINELKANNEKKTIKIRSLLKENKEKTRQLEIKNAAVTHLIRQFQKFITFTLKAVPTQAEFLLSIEKMLLFELNDVLKEAKVEKRQVEPKIIPWLFKEQSETDSKSDINNLEIQDFHNCLNEVDIPLKQDFRNMLSQGLEMKEDNKLWSKDVEEIIKKIEKEPEKRASFKALEPTSSKISVRFSNKKRCSILKTDSINNGNKHQKPLLKNMSELDNINFMDYIDRHSMKLSILGSRNSLEIIRKRLLGQQSSEIVHNDNINADESEKELFKESDKLFEEYQHKTKNKEPGIFTAETLSLSKASSQPSSVESLTENKVPSRLMLARDSLVIHRTSIMKKQSNLFLISPKDSLSLNAEKLSIARDLRASSSCTRSPRLTQARDSVELIKEMETEGRVIGRCSTRKPCNKCDDMTDSDSDDLTQLIKTAIEARRKQRNEESKVNVTKMPPRVSIEVRNWKKTSLKPSGSLVAFEEKPLVAFEPKIEYEKPAEPEIIVKSKSKKKKAKKSKIATYTKIEGDQNDESGRQSPEIFTKERIHSLVSIIKEYPDLISLFTAGVR